MKIIIGLGNPGDQYKFTRHNIGFMFLDYLINSHSLRGRGLGGGFSAFNYESKFKAEISEGKINGEKIILVKPQTFMNLSGEALQKILSFYKITKDDFIIIYDDKDMDFGKIRFRDKGSAGGHNGIKDIIKYVGENFFRIKIGVGNNKKYETSDWVLSKFSEEELINLENEIFPSVNKLLKEINII